MSLFYLIKGRVLMSDFNEDAKEIKNKVQSLYGTTKKNVAKAYKKTKPEAHQLASKISDRASDLYKNSKKSLNKTESFVEDAMTTYIRKQPLTAVLIAAGIGFLYAKIFK